MFLSTVDCDIENILNRLYYFIFAVHCGSCIKMSFRSFMIVLKYFKVGCHVKVDIEVLLFG